MLEGRVSCKFNENLYPCSNRGIKYEDVCPINLPFLDRQSTLFS